MWPSPCAALHEAATGLVRTKRVSCVDVEDLGETPVEIALKFVRDYVRKSRPVVLEDRQIHSWPALRLWTSDYLSSTLRSSSSDGAAASVRVNSTPNGRADAVLPLSADPARWSGGGPAEAGARCAFEGVDASDTPVSVFAMPEEIDMPVDEFLEWCRADSALLERQGHDAAPVDGHVLYLSQQNSNLETEAVFAPLFPDLLPAGNSRLLESDVEVKTLVPDWAALAFDAAPDAVNVWIGQGRSVSSVHHDPYDNLYVVVRGEKTFTLLPPCDAPLMTEGDFPAAHFRRRADAGEACLGWDVVMDSPRTTTPWINIDPDTEPGQQQGVDRDLFDAHGQPMRVTIRAGQALFLPCGWYHQVSHGKGDDDGKSVAVNFWFDPPYDSLAHVQGVFLEACVEHWRSRGELSQRCAKSGGEPP